MIIAPRASSFGEYHPQGFKPRITMAASPEPLGGLHLGLPVRPETAETAFSVFLELSWVLCRMHDTGSSSAEAETYLQAGSNAREKRSHWGQCHADTCLIEHRAFVTDQSGGAEIRMGSPTLSSSSTVAHTHMDHTPRAL
jgi:hypothetical protein